MKIRCITYFCNPGWPLDERIVEAAGKFLEAAKAAYEAAGYEVQFTRLATVPFPRLTQEARDVPELARQLDRLIQRVGIAYASLGPALPDSPQSYEVIPEALGATERIFFGGSMTNTEREIDVRAVRLCARIIADSAPLDANGFANLRFAALANVLPGTPFFPAAYHGGDQPAFAIATEAADLAVNAFSGAGSVNEAHAALVAEIEKHAGALVRVAEGELSKTHFGGIDFCLAPFPVEAESLGTAFERLGVPAIGLHGSLAAAAIITESIDCARFPRTGFSGLMMPVLEDATLARRASEGTLTVKDMLLYSAVCGTGLDTIPLPGDTTAEQLEPLLLDLCALALRLDKPLTARLMPIPGKRAGDPTTFDFGFFVNGKVMALESQGMSGPMGKDQTFEMRKR